MLGCPRLDVGRQIAQRRHVGVKRRGRAFGQRADGLVARRHCVHGVIAGRRIFGQRDVKQIHRGVIDVIVQLILDAPADRRFQFLARHIGSVHQQQLVVLRLE